MAILHKLATAALAVAVVTAPVSPALARDRSYGNGSWGNWGNWGGYGHGWRHRHHDDIDAGDVIAGVAVVGILAAVLASASKNRQVRQDRDPDRQDSAGRQGNIDSENEAIDACARATETQAGERASVRDINQVDRNADGWDIEGTVEERSGWRDSDDVRTHRFTCSVRYGKVEQVYIDSDSIALN